MSKMVKIPQFCVCMILSLMLMFSSSDALNRKLHTTFWPNCGDFQTECEIARRLGNNVVYTKASTDSHDNLHYVFSTIGIPTIVLARTTGSDATLYFQWDNLMSENISQSITFNNGSTKGFNLEYMYAVAFTRLIEYNDIPNNADLTDKKLTAKNFNIRDFRDFFWDTLPHDNKGKNEFVFNSTSDFLSPAKSNNGSLSFAFQTHGSGGRASDLPALIYTANVTQFDFVLANFTPSFNKSRFALEAVLVSLSENKKMSIDQTESIDDEYSPGVFQINNWLSNPSKQKISGFLQWKPVSYLSESRGRKSATKVKHYEIFDVSDRKLAVEQVEYSVVAAMFGDVWHRPDVIIRSSNISFGLSGDGYYLKNNYTVWSASVGYGPPPMDSISTTVVIIIAAGLGIPVLLIIFGGIYTIVRRMRGQSGYQAIGNGSINRNNPQVN